MRSRTINSSLRACGRKLRKLKTGIEAVSLRAPLGAQTETAAEKIAEREQRTLSSKPSKHFRLVLWWLLYRVHPQTDLTREHEREACAHARMKAAAYRREKASFPEHWERLLAKRERRRAWIVRWRWIAHAWTPPAPLDLYKRPPHWVWERKIAGEYFERIDESAESAKCFARAAVSASHECAPRRAGAPAPAKHWQRSGVGVTRSNVTP